MNVCCGVCYCHLGFINGRGLGERELVEGGGTTGLHRKINLINK